MDIIFICLVVASTTGIAIALIFLNKKIDIINKGYLVDMDDKEVKIKEKDEKVKELESQVATEVLRVRDDYHYADLMQVMGKTKALKPSEYYEPEELPDMPAIIEGLEEVQAPIAVLANTNDILQARSQSNRKTSISSIVKQINSSPAQRAMMNNPQLSDVVKIFLRLGVFKGAYQADSVNQIKVGISRGSIAVTHYQGQFLQVLGYDDECMLARNCRGEMAQIMFSRFDAEDTYIFLGKEDIQHIPMFRIALSKSKKNREPISKFI